MGPRELPPPGPPGRPPEVRYRLDRHLDDLIKHSKAWIARFEKVWFPRPSVLLEDGYQGALFAESPEWYQDAINRLLDIADFAADGAKRLEKGKAEAERKLAQKKLEEDSPSKAEEEPHDTGPEVDWGKEYEEYFGDKSPP
jgi:hypothetical protein